MRKSRDIKRRYIFSFFHVAPADVYAQLSDAHHLNMLHISARILGAVDSTD
jgi:hypothetical protein